MEIKDFFDLQEIVCKDVYEKYGQAAWLFFDSRLLATMLALRQRLNKAIFVNNWKEGGTDTQKGFRCIQCELVQKAITDKVLYVSEHMTGQAWDFQVEGLHAAEVRGYIIQNKTLWPYPIRLENNVSWIHLGTRNDGSVSKVILFNA